MRYKYESCDIMGIEYNYECKKCNYHKFIHLGIGFLFPKVYNDIVDEAKNGKYGKEIQAFLNMFSEGRIDAEDVLIVCQECGNIEVVPDLSMYIPKNEIPKKDDKLPWSVEFPFIGLSYLTHNDLINDYDLFERYDHKCSKCQGKTEIIARDSIKQKNTLKCPYCKSVLSLTGIGMCD